MDGLIRHQPSSDHRLLLQPRIRKYRSLDIGTLHLCIAQIGVGEVGVAQIGVGEIGFAAVGTLEIRAG